VDGVEIGERDRDPLRVGGGDRQPRRVHRPTM
jgi:hypothetical protein